MIAFKMAQMMLNERAMNVIYAQWNCLWIKPHIRKSIWMHIVHNIAKKIKKNGINNGKIRIKKKYACPMAELPFLFYGRNTLECLHKPLNVHTSDSFFILGMYLRDCQRATKKIVCWKWWIESWVCVCVWKDEYVAYQRKIQNDIGVCIYVYSYKDFCMCMRSRAYVCVYFNEYVCLSVYNAERFSTMLVSCLSAACL